MKIKKEKYRVGMLLQHKYTQRFWLITSVDKSGLFKICCATNDAPIGSLVDWTEYEFGKFYVIIEGKR